MGEHEPLVGPPKQDLLAEACGEEDVVGEGRSKSSSSSTSSTTSASTSSGAESPRSHDGSGFGAESFPVCPNCQLRHPGGESKGSFCTEGRQGTLETLVAMGTLGLVSVRVRGPGGPFPFGVFFSLLIETVFSCESCHCTQVKSVPRRLSRCVGPSACGVTGLQADCLGNFNRSCPSTTTLNGGTPPPAHRTQSPCGTSHSRHRR